jgi:Mn-containing catalase
MNDFRDYPKGGKMFYHVKELEFNARVSGPDPRFASLLLEQFGGGNGELKAAMQYFLQAFAAKKPFPDKYDMLMDIATEELSHLEIVGATITMLLDGINGELKNAVENNYMTKIMNDGSGKENIINDLISTEGARRMEMGMMDPQFLVLSGGGPKLTNSQGVPWSAAYVNANGDLTVDLRSNIAAESRAKIVYEYLIQFTDDPLVKESLVFLMTREIAHFNQFTAALETIQPNFPPGILQGDPRYSHLYVNMSNGSKSVRGPWNEGQGPWGSGEEWVYIDKPIEHVIETNGLLDQKPAGTKKKPDDIEKMDKELSQSRSKEIKQAIKREPGVWSDFTI